MPGFDADTGNSIGYLLRDNARHILADLTTRLEPHGITLPQYFVLRELWEEEGLTQREIAGRVGVLEPTMVTTLDALERRGLSVLAAKPRFFQELLAIHVGEGSLPRFAASSGVSMAWQLLRSSAY